MKIKIITTVMSLSALVFPVFADDVAAVPKAEENPAKSTEAEKQPASEGAIAAYIVTASGGG